MEKILKRATAFLATLAIAFSCGACDGEKGGMQGETEKTTEQEAIMENAAEQFWGYVKSGTYYNGYAQFKIELDEAWQFSDRKELAELMSLDEKIYERDYKDVVEEAGTVYTMFAQNPETAGSVNVTAVKSTEEMLGEKLTQNQATQLEEVYEQMDAEDVEITPSVCVVDGKELQSIDAKCGIYGIELNQRIIYFECEDYVFALTVTAIERGEIDSITEGISFGEIED